MILECWRQQRQHASLGFIKERFRLYGKFFDSAAIGIPCHFMYSANDTFEFIFCPFSDSFLEEVGVHEAPFLTEPGTGWNWSEILIVDSRMVAPPGTAPRFAYFFCSLNHLVQRPCITLSRHIRQMVGDFEYLRIFTHGFASHRYSRVFPEPLRELNIPLNLLLCVSYFFSDIEFVLLKSFLLIPAGMYLPSGAFPLNLSTLFDTV